MPLLHMHRCASLLAPFCAGLQGDETFKRQLAAADTSRLHTLVDNKLGVPAHMELDFGSHM